PSNYQKAALELSDYISDLPQDERTLKEYISDTHHLDSTATKGLFSQAEEIGFIDHELLDTNHKFYFNGNLFKRDNVKKTSAILSSLKPEDSKKISQLDELIVSQGCVPLTKARSILGEDLITKLQSIAMYDFNEVSNSKESI